MKIRYMIGINFNDDYNDEINPLLPFPLIPPLSYDYLKAKIKPHSSIKAPRFWSHHLCLSKITTDCVFYISNLFKTQAYEESSFVY